jgi:UDP-glucuronate decarboxylase
MSRNTKATVLVAGGAGFIGVNLCRRLLQDGHEVICLDNMSTGMPEHVDELSAFPAFRFVKHDIVEPMDLPVDRIYNLACPASPPAYQADPVKTTLTNVVGVRNLLELARVNGARILQASTSEIYGDPKEHPQKEDYCGCVNTMGPRSCYDEGKRCAETLMSDYRRMYGVDTRVARIFNTYGPGMREDDGRVVSNFIIEALQGLDITIYGNGSHTRSMCFVDDLVEGLVRFMDQDRTDAGPINLGSPYETTVLGFAHLVVELTGSKSEFVYLADAVDDPHVRRPDISRATEQLGWEPKVGLVEGVKETIAYFRGSLNAAQARGDRSAHQPRLMASN